MDDFEELLRGLGVIEFKLVLGGTVGLTVKLDDGATYGTQEKTLDQAIDNFTAQMSKEGRWRRG